MYAKVYMSSEKFDQEKDMARLLQIMVESETPCNVVAHSSILSGGWYGCHVEHGAQVTMFDVTADRFVAIWFAMRDMFGVHCIWTETEDFTGCSCNLPAYLDYCARNGLIPLLEQ